jgi:hypothetical protein
MFDVTQAASYDHIINWKSNVDEENKSGKPRPCILLANKVRFFLRVLLFFQILFFLSAILKRIKKSSLKWRK